MKYYKQTHKIEDTDEQLMCVLYQLNFPISDIADRFGLCRTSIVRIATKYNLKRLSIGEAIDKIERMEIIL